MCRSCSRYIVCLFVALSLTWMLSCSGRPGKPAEPAINIASEASPGPAKKLIKMDLPGENAGYRLNEPVKVALTAADNSGKPDSVVIYFNGKRVASIMNKPWETTVPPAMTNTTGRRSVKAVAYTGGVAANSVTRFAIIYSDVAPKKYGYRVVRSYPHDRESFTQGLFYDNGFLYEGTGQQAGSYLREVEPATGEVIRQHNLDRSLFGEGIALYNDRIYQVTWQNKVGFIYEKSTFRQLNKIYYQTEGWGLTTVKDRIVMSDGSNVLYFFEPETFTVASSVEVYDNSKKIDMLNELEYINGEIWANIWMSDLIARIDPASGKVLGYIDMKGLLPASDKKPDTDVLNGIAWDKAGGRIFVTGKRWPKLFEIRVTG